MEDDKLRPGESEGIGAQAMVEDLVLTDAFLIKGRVEGKFQRLSKVLEHYGRRFLVVSSATMVDLRRGDVIRTPRVHVNLDEVLLLHELIDGGGDFYLQHMSRQDKNVRIRAFVHGTVDLEIAGRIQRGAYERSLDRSGFFIMEDCSVRGLDGGVSKDFALLDRLGYAILNASRLSYLYDFS
ncbi:MAG: hypothetical protein R3F30_05460 [Planctomycetota bacterium]